MTAAARSTAVSAGRKPCACRASIGVADRSLAEEPEPDEQPEDLRGPGLNLGLQPINAPDEASAASDLSEEPDARRAVPAVDAPHPGEARVVELEPHAAEPASPTIER